MTYQSASFLVLALQLIKSIVKMVFDAKGMSLKTEVSISGKLSDIRFTTIACHLYKVSGGVCAFANHGLLFLLEHFLPTV
jgi:hypothetical protein